MNTQNVNINEDKTPNETCLANALAVLEALASREDMQTRLNTELWGDVS